MMRASSVAEATARAVVAAVGRLRREPLSKPPGVAEAVDWAEAATLLQARRALAGRVQALDRRRAEGRGGSHLHRAGSTPHLRRRPHDELQLCRARPAAFVSFAALLRATALPSRRNRQWRSWRGDRLLGPRYRRHPPRRVGDAGAAARARADLRALFDIHFHRQRSGAGAGAGNDESGSPSGRRRGDEPLLADEANESGQARPRRGAGRAPLRAKRDRRCLARASRARQPARLPRRAWPSPHARPARGGLRSAAHLARSVRNDGEVMRLAQNRAPGSCAQDPAADRRLRLDEGAHRRRIFVSRMRWRTRPRRGVHLRHAAHPRHPRAALKRREQALPPRPIWSAIGTAARASAMRCRPSSRCRASAAMRAARCRRPLRRAGARRSGALRDAVAKLSRRAWRLSWLTPLAADPGFQPQTEALIAILPLGRRSGRRRIDRRDLSRMFSRSDKGPRDRHRRCASSYLAAGRPALAARADAAAHLRPLRADPARLSDPEYLADLAGSGEREVGLCAGQLGARALRGRNRWVQRPPRNMAGRTPSSPTPISPRATSGPQLERLAALSAGARRAHAIALARKSALPFAASRPDLAPIQKSGATSRGSPIWLELRSAGVRAADGRTPPSLPSLSRRDLHPAARRHAGRSVAAGPLRLARRHEAAGRLPNVVSKLSGLGTFIHRNDPAHIAAIVPKRWRSSAPTAACSARIFRSKNSGPAIANCSTPIAPTTDLTRRRTRCAIFNEPPRGSTG
jgi:hypothetical protein